jgi:hypothetical protein
MVGGDVLIADPAEGSQVSKVGQVDRELHDLGHARSGSRERDAEVLKGLAHLSVRSRPGQLALPVQRKLPRDDDCPPGEGDRVAVAVRRARSGRADEGRDAGPCWPLGAALREYGERDLVGVKGTGRARVSLEMDEQLDDFFPGDTVVERDPQLTAQRLVRARDTRAVRPTRTSAAVISARMAPACPARSTRACLTSGLMGPCYGLASL